MSRLDSQQGLTPSLLDRLIDPESEGTEWRRGYGLDQMISAVRRDLEDLLNTHRSGEIPERFVEVRNSVANFGLPDLVSYNAVGSHAKEQIGRVIEEVVRRFEPRLRDVRAVLMDSGDGKTTLSMEFQINAKFWVEPSPEVAFVTILKLSTGQATVRQGEA